MSTVNTPLAHSVRDAAERVGISRSAMYLAIGRGELAIVKLGHRTVILDDDVREYLARHRVVADQPAAE